MRGEGQDTASSELRPFVAVSCFQVANDMSDAVDEAFVRRPGLVESAPGFLRMEVLRAEANPQEFWLLTYWEDETSFSSWHRGHSYKDSHVGIPKGLKVVRGSARLQFYRRICE